MKAVCPVVLQAGGFVSSQRLPHLFNPPFLSAENKYIFRNHFHSGQRVRQLAAFAAPVTGGKLSAPSTLSDIIHPHRDHHDHDYRYQFFVLWRGWVKNLMININIRLGLGRAALGPG